MDGEARARSNHWPFLATGQQNTPPRSCLVAAVQRLIQLPTGEKTRRGVEETRVPNVVQLLLLGVFVGEAEVVVDQGLVGRGKRRRGPVGGKRGKGEKRQRKATQDARYVAPTPVG